MSSRAARREPDRDESALRLFHSLMKRIDAGEADETELLDAHPDVAPLVNDCLAIARQVAGAESDSTMKVWRAGPDDFGDYESLEEIGRGGMGIVYKARQRSLHRTVAIKRSLQAFADDDVWLARFRVEAQAAAQLDHPAIVPVYDFGITQGHCYLVMAYISGESLADRLLDGPLEPRDAAQLLIEIAEGVEFAHGRGVIHRDLKPANLLIDDHGQPRIADFGLAKCIGDESGLTATGDILGTPGFMPPEQAAGAETNQLSDVYSLGAVLYTTLTGRPPFQAATVLDTLRQVTDRDPVPPRQLNADVPVDLETICLKCLEKSPARRYPTAAEFADDLRRFLEGKTVRARPASLMTKGRMWCRRKPAIAVLTLSIAMTVLIGTVSSSLFALHASRQAALAGQNLQDALRSQRDALDARNAALAAKSDADRNAAEAGRQQLAATRQLHDTKVALGDAHRLTNDAGRARAAYHDALDLSRSLGQSTLAADIGLLLTNQEHPGPLLGGVSQQQPQPTFGGAGETRWAFLSPDGLTAYLSRGGTLDVVDVATGCVLRRKHMPFRLRHVSLCPTTEAFVGCENIHDLKFTGPIKTRCFIYRISTTTLERTLTFPTPGQIYDLVVSADGKRAASVELPWGGDLRAKNRELNVWDLETGTCIETMDVREPAAVLFSPDHERLVIADSCGGNEIRDISSGKVLRSLGGARVAINQLRFLSDGRTLVGFDNQGDLRWWDSHTGELLRCQDQLSAHGRVVHRAFAPDADMSIATSPTREFSLWDLSTGRLIREFPEQRYSGQPLIAFNSRVAILGDRASLRVWSLKRAREIPEFDCGAHVSAIAFAFSGRTMLAAGKNRNIYHWDLATGRLLQVLRDTNRLLPSLLVTADQKTLVTVDWHGSGTIWDLSRGRATTQFRVDQGFKGLAFAEDGRHVLICPRPNTTNEDPEVITVRLSDGKEVARCELGQFDSSTRRQLLGAKVWHPKVQQGLTPMDVVKTSKVLLGDDRVMATLQKDGRWCLYDFETGNLLREFHVSSNHRSSDPTQLVRLSDGRIASSDGGRVRIWDFTRAQQERDHTEAIRDARRSLDDNPADVAALRTFARWHEFRGADGLACSLWERIRAAGGDVDSLTLAHCYWRSGQEAKAKREYERARQDDPLDTPYIELCLKENEEDPGPPQLRLVGHQGSPNRVVFSADGEQICSSSSYPLADHSIRIWDADNGKQLAKYSRLPAKAKDLLPLTGVNEPFDLVAPSSTGTTFACTDRNRLSIYLWDAESGDKLQTLRRQARPLNALQFIAEDRQLVSSDQHALIVWDCKTGQKVRQFEFSSDLLCWDVSPDGTLLATGHKDGCARLHRLLRGEQIAELTHERYLYRVHFLSDGRMLTCGQHDSVILWSCDGEELLRIESGQAGIRSLAVTNDERLVFTGGIDGTVRAWDLHSGASRGLVGLHGEPVLDLALSPDESRLATSGGWMREFEIRVWDLERFVEASDASANYDDRVEP